MRAISITLLITFTIVTLSPSASAEESEGGYYVLAVLFGVGAYGCYAIYKNVEEEELNMLFQHRDEIEGFTYGWYWSSSVASQDRYWGQSFEDGYQEAESKTTSYNIHKGGLRVRCVREK